MLNFMALYQLTATQIPKLIANKHLRAGEIVEAFARRIDEVEKDVGALINKTFKQALAQADMIDRLVDTGSSLPPLAGVPVVIKDNLALAGYPMTCGSKILKDYIPPYNATVCNKLRQAGALFIGKANMDEFAMGSSNENSAFYPAKNPWDISRSPGGSSGGTAAAVAIGEAPLGLGSDTGGSVRQPASFCGITAIKPTYGRISRYGLAGFASSLDQVGPMARTVKDTALLLEVLAGADEMDILCSARNVPPYVKSCGTNIGGIRIGLPRQFFGSDIEPEIKAQVLAAVSCLEKEGAIVEDCSLPSATHSLSVYQIISSAEACSNLARVDGVRYGNREKSGSDWQEMIAKTRGAGLGFEVKRRLLLGAYVLQQDNYEKYFMSARQIRFLLIEEFMGLFADYDVLIAPTTSTTSFRLGKDSADMPLSDVLTVPASLAGVPALSLPCGLDSSGLPIGLQIIGNYFSEEKMFSLAQRIENIVAWRDEPVELNQKGVS